MSYSGSSELSHIVPTYNSPVVDNISEILSGDSVFNSREIKKLLSEGCSSPMHKNLFECIDYDRKYEMCCFPKIQNLLLNNFIYIFL